MHPFSVDWSDLNSVIEFAKQMARKYPKYPQFVFKRPDRANYNITMQPKMAVEGGGVIVWQSVGSN